MRHVSGPFPITAEITAPSFRRATEAERGLTMLAHYVHFHDDDKFGEEAGWQRFNTEAVHHYAAQLVADVLHYIYATADGSSVRRALAELIELIDTDDEYLEGEGIGSALQDAVPGKRLAQIAADQSAQAQLMKRLATHLGVQPHS
ncbi:hypothetical protein [Streptomyces lydicus]|uniref:hypothetical protein n=1 Tax=Streptomyces lydicus TaxID=47763 RepID=UPI00101050D9|nr:hypothetical protein [Streptomyces lydicus]MCZ1012030.1 hypothetical protein [Streptomyces lydicus]